MAQITTDLYARYTSESNAWVLHTRTQQIAQTPLRASDRQEPKNKHYLSSRLHALLCKGLDNIADLKFIEIFEYDAALVTAGYLAHIVFTTS